MLLVVLVSIMVAAFALTLFMEKATDDLLVEARELDARRLRAEAYSALETSLCVLNEFKLVNGSLRSPAEGWGDPLSFASYEAAEGRRVEVEFVDESGKLSLPKQTFTNLVDLFKSWEMAQSDAEKLADALLDWCNADHVASSGFSNTYEEDDLQFGAPGRSIRSWSELASIDLVRELFFDEQGVPNSYWQRFTDTVSLLSFSSTNVNAARPGVLTALGVGSVEQANLGDYLAGTGSYTNNGAAYFKSSAEAASFLGMQGGLSSLGAEIRALRINLTVWEGRSHFRLSVVVGTSGSSAKAVAKKANPSNRTKSTSSTTTEKSKTVSAASSLTDTSPPPSLTTGSNAGASSSTSSASESSLNYPFTILEIRENDAMPQSPSASVPPPASK